MALTRYETYASPHTHCGWARHVSRRFSALCHLYDIVDITVQMYDFVQNKQNFAPVTAAYGACDRSENRRVAAL